MNKNRVDILYDNTSFLIQYEAERTDENGVYIVTDNQLRYEVKYPEDPTEQQVEYIIKILNECEQAVYEGDWEKANGIMDVESLAKLYVLDEFMKPVDANYSSVFFYYVDGKIHAGPAWDYDLSSGNVSLDVYPYYYVDDRNYEVLYVKTAGWASGWFEFEEFNELVRKEFEQQYPFMNNIDEYINELLDEYGDVFRRNYSQSEWVVNEQYSIYMKVPAETYEENVDNLRWYFSNRTEYLRKIYMSLH